MGDELARILSLLSHELRSPLGVIRGYLGLLKQSPDQLTDLQRQAIAAALKASDRLAEVLAQANSLAQLHRHDARHFEPVSLDTLVSPAIDAVRLPATPAIRIERGSIPTVTVSADSLRLRDAVTALVSAVVRAQTKAAEVSINADLQDRDHRRGVSLRIVSSAAVSNPSEGPVDLSRGGLGLDLPIANVVIAAHGGQLGELREGERLAGMVVWLPLS